MLSYLLLFALDRVTDTPGWARMTIFVVAAGRCAAVPIALHRWVWRHRRLEQLARLLSRRYPSIGDQMLGIIELVRNEFEQSRSRSLCEAAIRQVAEAAGKRDFRDAVPNPRHRLWAWLAGGPLVVALLLLGLFPSAAANAWSRLLAPWRPIPRFTFTRIDELPETLVVPHGEPVTLPVRLADDSRWQPESATAQSAPSRRSPRCLPIGNTRSRCRRRLMRAGCNCASATSIEQVRIEPMLRPELSAVEAIVRLPEYLGRPEPMTKDVRGGTLSLVLGSVAEFSVTANRELAAAEVDGEAVPVAGPGFRSGPITIYESCKPSFAWKDQFGLAGVRAVQRGDHGARGRGSFRILRGHAAAKSGAGHRDAELQGPRQ